MVRLLKVKELEERKRVLLAKSEMYRQTLTLETANLKFSAALLKRKLKSPKSILALLGMAALPTAGLIFARKKKKAPQPTPGLAGLLPKVMAGVRMAMRVAPLVQRFRAARSRPAPASRQHLHQHP